MTYFRQCVLERGSSCQTSWLPEKYAVVGTPLKLKENGQWQDGWVVREVGSARIAEDKLYEHHKLGNFGSLVGGK